MNKKNSFQNKKIYGTIKGNQIFILNQSIKIFLFSIFKILSITIISIITN